MITKSAKTVDELRQVVDELEKSINVGLKSTTERELADAEAGIRTAFLGLEWNIRTVAREIRTKLDSHRVDIRYGRTKAPLSPRPEETKEVSEEKSAEDSKEGVEKCKPKNTRRSKKSMTTS